MGQTHQSHFHQFNHSYLTALNQCCFVLELVVDHFCFSNLVFEIHSQTFQFLHLHFHLNLLKIKRLKGHKTLCFNLELRSFQKCKSNFQKLLHFNFSCDFWINYLPMNHCKNRFRYESSILCFDGRSIVNLIQCQPVRMGCKDFLSLWNSHDFDFWRKSWFSCKVLNHLSNEWPLIFLQLHCWNTLFAELCGFRVFLMKYFCDYQKLADRHVFWSIFVF